MQQMSSSASRSSISAHPDTNSHGFKRRQVVRKGTFSCWECKRRKTRCEFKNKSSSVCVSCQRRGASCIGQEFADPAESNEVGVEERIVQVESLVSRLFQQRKTQPRGLRLTGNENENDDFRDEISAQTADLNPRDNIDWSSPSLLTTSHKLFPGSRSLSSQLYAIFPHPTKAALILSRGKFSNLPIHVRGQPSRKNTTSVICAEQISEQPSPTAHPVHFARKLIQLALCLHQLDKPVYDAARRYVEIASRYVTSQDSLMESIDGIETLMLESCYYIDIGSIRSAWLVVRRAQAIAQLIGLPLQAEEADCREENVWFRLTLGDRALSWMLGLPLSVTENTFAKEHELAANAWSTKMDRIHAVVFGHIITRNLRLQRARRRSRRHLEEGEDDFYDDWKVTQDIDHELKQAARSLPTSWWLSPNLKNGSMHVETMEKTENLIAQMHHHFLLIALHQPYVIRNSYPTSTNYSVACARSPFDEAYSQSAVLSASREALSGFLLLRSFHRTLSYRGADDKAFIAAMMFLLVHLHGHSLGRANVLEHQRPHDLGIINEVICIIEETSSANEDALSASMARVLKKLLRIEAHAADGRNYSIWMEKAPVGKDYYEFREEEDGLSLPMPYFGSIRIAHHEPKEFQSRPNRGSDSIYTAEPVSGMRTTNGYTETRDSTSDRGPSELPLTSGVQLQHAINSNEAIDYGENLDLQFSMAPNQGTSQFNRAMDPRNYSNDEEDTTFLSTWLNLETPAEELQVGNKNEIWPIES